MTKKEKELTREFLIPYTSCYVFCFSLDSTQKWKEKFCEDRIENFMDEVKDKYETQVKVSLDNETNLKQFKKIYKDLFMEEVENYLVALKKAKDEEEKERIKTEGVRRGKVK